ncbi:MAG: aminoglycoside phosphotransferase family protein [Desulfobacterium sp.]|nr:aminoglycoside phosphotransferase family protein [Desulfobacterium sp.]
MKELTDIEYLNRVARGYGLELCRLHGDAGITGSPERSLNRTVAENTPGEKYIIEELAPDKSKQKQRLGEHQHALKDLTIPHVHPPLKNREGSVLTERDGRFFQITPYVPGVTLPRPEYVMDAWRGEAMADFLISLYRKTRGTKMVRQEEKDGRFFSIADYVQKIVRDIDRKNPEIASRVRQITASLEDRFMAVHDNVPRIFCHGDFHVMNVIWGTSGISGVIDWEFCGLRPDVYDVANMIGCIGIEDPNALGGPLVTRFLEKLTQSGLISKRGWETLAEFIIALRFAWLAEWLRNNDREMIELELVYMKLLADNQATLFR